MNFRTREKVDMGKQKNKNKGKENEIEEKVEKKKIYRNERGLENRGKLLGQGGSKITRIKKKESKKKVEENKKSKNISK